MNLKKIVKTRKEPKPKTSLKYLGVHFLSVTDDWSTPRDVYNALNDEFHFDDDPCPIGGSGGLDRDWGSCSFINPPYSDIANWCKKAYEEYSKGKTVVMLIPSRTDPRYWHSYIMKATQIRFIKGRLRFGEAKGGAPFPSCVVVFKERGEPK